MSQAHVGTDVTSLKITSETIKRKLECWSYFIKVDTYADIFFYNILASRLHALKVRFFKTPLKVQIFSQLQLLLLCIHVKQSI